MDFEHESRALERRKAETFDDQQRELAGLDAGRIPRFLSQRLHGEAKRGRDESDVEHASRLAVLLTDAAYRRSYKAVWTTLLDVEEAAEAALQVIARNRHLVKQDLAEIEQHAARLPDGTMVFRDADGDVRRTDGSDVIGPEAETILWSGNEPSFEAYRDRTDQLDRLDADRFAIETYQIDTLGSARNRLSDADTPPSKEELEGILESIQTGMPNAVRAEMPSANSEPEPIQPSSDVGVPKL